MILKLLHFYLDAIERNKVFLDLQKKNQIVTKINMGLNDTNPIVDIKISKSLFYII
jgi:hypothetical protein